MMVVAIPAVYIRAMIRTASPSDLQALYNLTAPENHVKDNAYFERCLDEQAAGARNVFIAVDDTTGSLHGYCHYQRRPKYQPFRRMEIPEIQDLYTGPELRRQGVATALIAHCVAQAKIEQRDLIGIGVALHSGSGKAQRLYAQLGFVPDGAGLVYEREAVPAGRLTRVDDELCLMLIREVRSGR